MVKAVYEKLFGGYKEDIPVVLVGSLANSKGLVEQKLKEEMAKVSGLLKIQVAEKQAVEGAALMALELVK